jgi:hypothetical protein
MATFNLRKFSEADRLKTIKPSRLLEFLKPYDDYLSRRGSALPSRSDDQIDYEALAHILIHPDDSVPREMVDALYFVHEMAADEQMDELLETAKQHQLPLDTDQESSPADVAVQIWLAAPGLLQEARRGHSDPPKELRLFRGATWQASLVPRGQTGGA